jgi:hypothetical protein
MQFLRDRGGTGFWHETYFRGGQIEMMQPWCGTWTRITHPASA